MNIFDDIYRLAASQLDLLLIVAIVSLVQALKSHFSKVPRKLWSLVMIVLGFLCAWLTSGDNAGVKEVLRKGLIYAAGSEFAYQTWRTVKDSLLSKLKKEK